MAEATLNDVITRMKEEGLLTRNSGTNSLKSAISEIKGVRSDFKGFFNNFGSALQNLGSTQKEFSDMMKSNFEKQQEALASQQRNDALADEPKPTETDDNKGAISKLLESIKKMIPKKSPGLIGLLFGGLAAAFLLFPEWVKSNLILPLVDVINVLQGKNATTTLGAGIKHLKDLFGFINETFGPEAAWILGIGSLLALRHPIKAFKITKATISGLSSLVSWAAKSGTKLLGFKGAANAALDATGGGPPNRPKKLGPLARLSSAISKFGKNIATKATEIAGSSKNIIKNLGSMVGKAAGKAGAGGSGLLKLGGTLLRLGGPTGLVVLGVAGIALAADKLRDMNIDSTVKDISDKNAALKAAIASGNGPLVETLTAELARDLKRLQDTTIGNVDSVQEQIKLAQNTLAEEATKNLAISLAKLQEKSIRNADGSVAEGAAEALHAIKKALNKQVQELLVGNKARTPDQIKEKEDKTLTFLNNLRKDLNDNKISPEDQKEVISRAVEQILKVRAAKGGIARGSTLASELSNVQDTNQTLEQMFKTLDRLSKNNNLKFETTGKNNGQADVLANSGNPSSQTSPVVPIVAPTTNNTDNTRVVNNYYFYNDGSIDAAGRYSGMRLPSYA